MLKIVKKLSVFLIILYYFNSSVIAEVPYFVDFKYILNQSDAGKKAQNHLKSKLENGLKKLKDKEKKIQNEEKKIIEQKKLVSTEEYKKKVSDLRKKVSLLQKERSNLLNTVAKQRTKARNELLKNLNPIIKDYMNEKKIRMVIDKKSLLLADENLNLTKEIISRLNKKLKSINLE
jgi:outer membrane protein|tara:strand:+ start:465 stop:992 length:528 start_codon:yes stop_codon:yes gene_type:complete